MSSIKELVYSNAEFTWTPRDGTQLSVLSKCGLLSDQTPAQILFPENFASQIIKNDIYYKRK